MYKKLIKDQKFHGRKLPRELVWWKQVCL